MEASVGFKEILLFHQFYRCLSVSAGSSLARSTSSLSLTLSIFILKIELNRKKKIISKALQYHAIQERPFIHTKYHSLPAEGKWKKVMSFTVRHHRENGVKCVNWSHGSTMYLSRCRPWLENQTMADTTQKILTLINNNRKYRPWGLGKHRPWKNSWIVCAPPTLPVKDIIQQSFYNGRCLLIFTHTQHEKQNKVTTYPTRKPGGWSPDFSVLLWAIPDNLRVNRTTDTIVKFHVQLGKRVNCHEKWKTIMIWGQFLTLKLI